MYRDDTCNFSYTTGYFCIKFSVLIQHAFFYSVVFIQPANKNGECAYIVITLQDHCPESFAFSPVVFNEALDVVTHVCRLLSTAGSLHFVAYILDIQRFYIRSMRETVFISYLLEIQQQSPCS